MSSNNLKILLGINNKYAKPRKKRIRKPTIKCNENYFENIDTPNKAYYLGFIAGDSMQKNI